MIKDRLSEYTKSKASMLNLRSELSRDLRPFSMNPMEAILLLVVSQSGEMTCTRIAQTLDVVPPRVTGIVKSLKEAGLVDQRKDGTTIWVSLTDKGKQTVERLNEI